MKRIWASLVVVVLIVVGIAAPVGAVTTLEYRYWNITATPLSIWELKLEPARSRWGLRGWTVSGYDDDSCGSHGLCYRNDWKGADITYALNLRHRLFVGYYRIDRTLPDAHAMTHQGVRLGAMGTLFTAGRLSGIYDASYAWDQYNQVAKYAYSENGNGEVAASGTGEGIFYRLGLRYDLSPWAAVEVGQQNAGFTLPAHLRTGLFGRFQDHAWSGLTFGFVVRK